MHAAGVVADHSAESAAIMSRRIGPESQMMFLSRVAQMVEDHTGLNSGDAARRIDFHNLRHVLRTVEHHGAVAALPCKRSASATAQDGRTQLPGQRDRGNDVFHVARQNYSDRDLPVV